MKKESKAVLQELADGIRQDKAKLLPALALFLCSVAMVAVGAAVGGVERPVFEFVGILFLLTATFVAIAPKGVARVASVFGLVGATLVMTAGTIVLLNGGGIIPPVERGIAWTAGITMLPLLAYTVKTRLIDAGKTPAPAAAE